MDSVSICNLSLMMLGMPSITSFEDENNSAKLCKNFYPVLRDRVLRDHHWSFATSFYKLQLLAEECADPEFRYCSLLPCDVIRVIQLAGNSPYRIAGNRIFINDIPATLIYTRREEDSSKYDETFVEALQYLLAAEIGMSNTRDGNLIQFYRREYERRLSQARSIDSQENRFAMQNSGRKSNWLSSRRSSGGCDGGKITWSSGNAGKQN